MVNDDDDDDDVDDDYDDDDDDDDDDENLPLAEWLKLLHPPPYLGRKPERSEFEREPIAHIAHVFWLLYSPADK